MRLGTGLPQGTTPEGLGRSYAQLQLPNKEPIHPVNLRAAQTLGLEEGGGQAQAKGGKGPRPSPEKQEQVPQKEGPAWTSLGPPVGTTRGTALGSRHPGLPRLPELSVTAEAERDPGLSPGTEASEVKPAVSSTQHAWEAPRPSPALCGSHLKHAGSKIPRAAT